MSHYNGLYRVHTQAAFKGRAHKTKHALCNYTKQSENKYRLMITIVVLVKMCWSLPQSRLTSTDRAILPPSHGKLFFTHQNTVSHFMIAIVVSIGKNVLESPSITACAIHWMDPGLIECY